jgi:AraC-like DNA-binding protein
MHKSKHLTISKQKCIIIEEGIFMQNFIDSNLDIKEVVYACYVPSGTGKSKHTDRPSHGLALHLSGEKNYNFSDGTVLSVSEGDIIFMPKNSSYVVSSQVPGNCYAINFNIHTDIKLTPFVFRTKAFQEYITHFKNAKKHWDKKEPAFFARCKSELYSIIALIIEEYGNSYVPKSKYSIIEPGVKYINKNYTTENISISKLAELCSVTPEYFRRIFHEFFGTSPIIYINKMKISRAKELISSGMYSISEVCLLSGYTDASHFSREFKKAVGVSPSEYRPKQ